MCVYSTFGKAIGFPFALVMKNFLMIIYNLKTGLKNTLNQNIYGIEPVREM